VKQREASHVSVAERVQRLEATTDKAVMEVKTAFAKLDHMNHRLTSVQDAWKVSPRH